jgi:hypothetical protein
MVAVALAVLATPAIAQVQTFTDKAAFLAATGATSATGPLPNLHCVASGGTGSATIGSVTFRVGPGGDDLCIGMAGGDWYPPTAGNDIAQGIESLEVETAALVFALGFDFVEPNATVQPGGGVPVNSPFQVTLYNGTTQVGQFTFDAPDDVVAFVGVQSAQAFNRAVIVDTTGNDDDEYFGQSYSGTVPFNSPPLSFTEVAASGASVPGGPGVFTNFPQSPAVSANITAFLGLGSGGTRPGRIPAASSF